MRKICVFVEGQTEQIFVRDFLLKWYEYDHIAIECYQIVRSDTYHAEYDVPNPNAETFYQIINVGNDNRVLSFLLDRVEKLKEKGFERIIGLRDMYGKAYRDRSQSGVIDEKLNQSFISLAKDSIEARLSSDASLVSFHFAIMEIEAWMLAMYPSLLKKFPELKEDDLRSVYNIDEDIERTVYHPADTLNEVFQMAGSSYEKHKSDANSIVSYMDKEDFETLLNSGKSQTFKSFVEALVE